MAFLYPVGYGYIFMCYVLQYSDISFVVFRITLRDQRDRLAFKTLVCMQLTWQDMHDLWAQNLEMKFGFYYLWITKRQIKIEIKPYGLWISWGYKMEGKCNTQWFSPQFMAESFFSVQNIELKIMSSWIILTRSKRKLCSSILGLSFIQATVVPNRKILNKLLVFGSLLSCSCFLTAKVILFTIMHVLVKVLFFIVLSLESI